MSSTTLSLAASVARAFTIFITGTLAGQLLLPELTGPHEVGITHLELVDQSRQDKFAPSPTPRDLMISLYFPAAISTTCQQQSDLAPQFPPATASYIDSLLNLTAGTGASLTTRAHLNAPIDDHGNAPVILFSHGFSFIRGLYTAILSDLASWGWIVAAVDHPYDAGIVEYPDGRVVRARNWSWPLDPSVREQALDIRTADMLFVLSQLGNETAMSQIPGVSSSELLTKGRTCHILGASSRPFFNTTCVVALGHSFGGATAIEMLLNSSAVTAATDLDGFLYGPVVRQGTEKPVLVLGFPEHFATDDPTAAPGWPNLLGWKRDFTVQGTVHESYTDYPVWRDLLGGHGRDAGSVTGTRMTHIIRTYVDTFFQKFLLGVNDAGFLSGNSSYFPEVVLRRQ